MKPELQRIAIAEVCGWKLKHLEKPDVWFLQHGSSVRVAVIENLPDYLNDLNAMREAENVLNTERAETFVSELANTIQMKRTKATINSDYFIVAHASAAQRAEAFLRCIGKWQDDAS
jgi:hypothetical protein